MSFFPNLEGPFSPMTSVLYTPQKYRGDLDSPGISTIFLYAGILLTKPVEFVFILEEIKEYT